MAKIIADKLSAMNGPINTAVLNWMRANGINSEDVRGYTLTYDAGDLMTIDVRMFMTDELPAPAKPICLCGSRSPDPEMHDVIACPIGSAEYERTHGSDS